MFLEFNHINRPPSTIKEMSEEKKNGYVVIKCLTASCWSVTPLPTMFKLVLGLIFNYVTVVRFSPPRKLTSCHEWNVYLCRGGAPSADLLYSGTTSNLGGQMSYQAMD